MKFGETDQPAETFEGFGPGNISVRGVLGKAFCERCSGLSAVAPGLFASIGNRIDPTVMSLSAGATAAGDKLFDAGAVWCG